MDAQTVARGLGYAAGMALIGGLLYFSWVEPHRPTGLRRWILSLAAVGTLVSGIGLLATQAAVTAGGEISALANPADWLDVFEGTFAVGVSLRVGAGIVALGGLHIGGAAPVAAASAVASYPFLGHGIARDPAWLVFPADIVHVLAVAVWTGGLLMLVLGLVPARPARSLSASTASPIQAIGRFSAVAGAALAGAFVTGLLLAATELDTPGDVADTSYGRRLVLKLVLVACLVGLGAFQRYRVIPRIRAEGAGSPAVRTVLRAGAIEIVVMGLVILITTFLVNSAG